MDYLSVNTIAVRSITEHTAHVSREIGFTAGYARALTVTGNSYWYDGIYDLAQNYYLLAAREYESIADSIGLGQTYNNMGEVYKRMKEYRKSLHYLLLSLRFKGKGLHTHAITLYNIGEAYFLLNDIGQAEDYFKQSLALATKYNQKRVIAYSYWGLARVIYRHKNYSKALDNYQQAEEIFLALDNKRLLIEIYQDKSDVYRSQGIFWQAELYLQKAGKLLAEWKGTDLEANNYFKYALLDSARGNFGSAMRNMYRYHALKDSIFNILKTEQLSRLQLNYETEVRERENQQLRTEKKLQEARVKTQQVIIASISIVLIVVLVLSLFLYYQHKKIKQFNQVLTEKNNQIELQKVAIESQAVALAKLNEELKDLNKILEKRIEERTRQLTVQNQKLLEYTFINAHKLRAPVASILGLINLLDHNILTDAPDILQHLKTCGEQLDNITRQISRNLEGAIIEPGPSEVS